MNACSNPLKKQSILRLRLFFQSIKLTDQDSVSLKTICWILITLMSSFSSVFWFWRMALWRFLFEVNYTIN